MARLTPRERFDNKVSRTDSCWEWTAAKHPTGYGKFFLEGQLEYAHRVAYSWAKGAIVEGMVIDHTCHNRSCVNPHHLRMVTGKQNQENRAGAMCNSKSGIRGVSWNSKRSKWAGYVRNNSATVYVGYYDNVREAEAAVIAKRNELFTHNNMDRAAA